MMFTLHPYIIIILFMERTTLCLQRDEARVFELQTEGMEPGRADVYLRHDLASNTSGVQREARDLTVCYRVKIAQYREAGNMFFSYAYSDHMDNALLFFQHGNILEFYYNDVKESASLGLVVDDSLNRWHHHCFIFTHPYFSIMVDGEEVVSGQMSVSVASVPLNGTLYVGQDQDRYDGGLDPTQALSATVTQVNMWDFAVSPTILKMAALCKENPHGNIFSTDVTLVEAPNVTESIAHIDTFCKYVADFVVIPKLATPEEALDFCSRANSTFYIPEGEDSNERLYNQSSMFLEECGMRSYRLLFLGASDDEEEGIWRNINNNQAINYSKWSPGEPNGGRKGNCAVMRVSDGKWSDTLCSEKQCFSCLRTHQDFFFLRGLCEPRRDMTRFVMTGYINRRPYFRGFYKYIIYYSKDNNWLLWHTVTNTTLAMFTTKEDFLYPIGRREWTVMSPFCGYARGSTVVMGLSTCTNYHFMCSDGACVSRVKRCNLQDDCDDGSDEENCSIVEFSEKYFNYRPPPSGIFGQPLGVEPLVDLVRFSKIDDIDLAFNVEIEVTLLWRDRNLKFQNLRTEEGKNKLSINQMKDIWVPEVEFLNIYDGRQKDLKSSVVVRIDGPSDHPNFNDIKMNAVHSPLNAKLVLRHQYSASFSCNFLLFNYPFDTQNCSIFLRLSSADTEILQFQNATVVYRGMRNLHKFTIKNEEITLTEKAQYSVIKVGFQLERRYSLLVLTIFIPTFLLILIGYSTLYIQLSAFQVRSIMTLTTMLVMYTLFNQVSSGLPETAYIKMLDMWFFFCIFLILSIIVVHISVEHLEPGTPQSTIVKPIHGHTIPQTYPAITKITGPWVMLVCRRYIYPIIVIIFNVLFWIVIIFVFE